MVSWWPGDGNANDVWSANNAVSYNGGFAAGKVGQAFDVNGTTQFADFGNPASLQITTPITIDAWISPDTIGAGKLKTVASKFSQSPTNSSYGLFIEESGGTTRVRGYVNNSAG
jgi:hypothetical protein